MSLKQLPRSVIPYCACAVTNQSRQHTHCDFSWRYHKGSPRPARNIHRGGVGDNFAQVSRGLRQRDSRGYPHQRDSLVVAFATMYSSSDEEEALLLLALEDEEISRFVFLSDRCRSYIIFFPRDMQNLFFRRKKRKWVHEINLERKDFGESHTLMPELRQDEKRFYIYFRMPSECFDEILSLIKEDITKKDTNYREAISAEERLAITLR